MRPIESRPSYQLNGTRPKRLAMSAVVHCDWLGQEERVHCYSWVQGTHTRHLSQT